MASLRISSLFTAVLLAGCGASIVQPTTAVSQQAPSTLADQIGVTNTTSLYQYNTSESLMDEGRHRLAATSTEFGTGLGTHVIKLWFTSAYATAYPHTTNWGTINSMKDLANSTPYANTFADSNFNTYILEANEFCQTTSKGAWTATDWKSASFATNTTLQACVKNEFKTLAASLLSTYNNTGKTFVLQHWEGDNNLNPSAFSPAPSSTETCPAGTNTDYCIAVRNMILWLQLRQDGVSEARSESNSTNVTVAAAAEMNAITGFARTWNYPHIVDLVIPNISMDLYSCSCYSADTPGSEYNLYGMLAYIQNKRTDSALYGSKNVYIGEFSTPESQFYSGGNNWSDDTSAKARVVTGQQVEYALRWGARWVVFWELYSNGLVGTSPNQYYDGVWLIRPQDAGSTTTNYTQTWNYFQSIMSSSLTDYRYIYEAENHYSPAAGSTVTETETTDPALSGGRGTKLTAAATDSKLTYSVYIPETGTYTLSVRMKTGPTNGIFAVKVNSTSLGSTYDTYSSATGYQTYNVYTGTMSKGAKTIDLVVSNKNAASTDFDLEADYIRIAP
ncbi:MAG: hypothetical protein PW792_01975 [Acidobacteriaceae bacterium]|nr:hypothetical protein [Acidobacteriaceae bacterium]